MLALKTDNLFLCIADLVLLFCLDKGVCKDGLYEKGVNSVL